MQLFSMQRFRSSWIAPGRIPASPGLYLTVLLGLGLTGICQAQDKTAAGEDEAAAAQKKKAEYNWKRAFETGTPTLVETKYLLLYSKLPADKLEPLAEQLHRQMALAARALEMQRNDLWKGKLAVYILPDREDFETFVRRTERRRVMGEERGSYLLDKEASQVAAGPRDKETPAAPTDLTVAEQAGAELAMALLEQKFGRAVPFWVRQGFGRATVL